MFRDSYVWALVLLLFFREGFVQQALNYFGFKKEEAPQPIFFL